MSPVSRRLATSAGVLVLAWAAAAGPGAAQPVATGSTSIATAGPLQLTVAGTEAELPIGRWQVVGMAPPHALEQAHVLGQPLDPTAVAGGRVGSAQRARRVESSRWRLQSLYSPVQEYAAARGGRGPASLADLDTAKWGPLLQNLERSPWPEDASGPGGSPGPDKSARGPFFFLVPNVPIPEAGRRPAAAGTPLALELRPYVDDGKHWVLLSNGTTERRAIDRELIARHSLAIAPVTREPEPVAAPATRTRYRILALVRDPAAKHPRAKPVAEVTLSLAEAASGDRVEVRWNLAGASAGPPALLADWARARAGTWAPLAARPEGRLLRAWLSRLPEVYGSRQLGSLGPRPENDRLTDAFSILGGRAALQETLQLQLLRGAGDADAPATVALAGLPRVQVKSHPFAEMLGTRAGGRLPLADSVPEDRLFVYFARPAALFPFLDHGADFLAQAGALFTKSAVDDDLKARYLRRLGVGEGLGRRFLESGEVTELALVAPDLFFLDGTDLTVLMRVRNPERVAAAMTLLGFPAPPRDGIAERALAGGGAAYWGRQGHLLAVSTRRSELEAVLALDARQGAGSLGRSAEFRYMLTQLPIQKETRAFVYLSDPFVRRMVGPEVKIGQLRRMRARADMELVTAGALLHRLDAGRPAGTGPDAARRDPALDELVRLGYVARAVAGRGYQLRDDGVSVSPLWGRAGDLHSLLASPVERATASEAEAYRTYVDEYTRYWRQYFDPVAMRLDDGPGGALELTTFILPLPDSQLYTQVRGLVLARDTGPPLRVPVLAPEPVLQLSVRLTEEAWVSISGQWSEMFSRYTGLSPAIFDRLGPGLHVAVQDADPIIALGNADLLGSLSGPLMTMGTMSQGLPLLLAVLTRPCKILVELPDPEFVRTLLRRASGERGAGRRRDAAVEFRQVEGRDAWIYSLGIAGVIKVRFGIEVRDGFLVLSNVPWSQPVTIKSVETRPLNGAELLLAPGAVRDGLPGLFATQSEQNQLAALGGMAMLYPLMLTGSATPAEAAARHAALFGGAPVHPASGRPRAKPVADPRAKPVDDPRAKPVDDPRAKPVDDWTWRDPILESSIYGTATRWIQPAYRPDLGDFGLFAGVSRLSVNMQLESDGLRATARWLWKPKP